MRQFVLVLTLIWLVGVSSFSPLKQVHTTAAFLVGGAGHHDGRFSPTATAAFPSLSMVTTSSSSSSSSNTDDTVEDDKEDQQEKSTKQLCQERNLQLDIVKNARDLASVCVSTPNTIIPNKIYRMGRVSDASSDDISLLFDELSIKTLVDLRSPTELKDDPTLMRDDVYSNFTNLLWSEARIHSRHEPGCVRELPTGESPLYHRKRRTFLGKIGTKKRDKEDDDDVNMVNGRSSSSSSSSTPLTTVAEECDVCGDGAIRADQFLLQSSNNKKKRPERHFVSLMNEFKYVKGTMKKVRKRDIARVLLKSPGAILSRRVRVSCKKPFLDEINQGGLIMLNELLLRYGAPGIKYVLELCADPDRHPVAFYCTAGKDRTGMIAALILSLMGVPDEDIVQDYSLSANVYAEMDDHQAMVGALSQRSLDPKTFLGAPPYVMEGVLETIRDKYGSVEGYLDWIGFGAEKQKKLRDVLTIKEETATKQE